ncbi:MAG: peptide deformylase [Pseudomonadota bacterium]|nr:peptide deformylase [Pseudomonadota bacterium]
MTVLPIIIAPDPRLKKKSLPVKNINDELRVFMDDMLETMYSAPGIGLAGPQVGLLQRIIVADVSQKEGVKEPHQLINPEILSYSDELYEYEEGCLSLPDQYSEVVRPKRVAIQYLNTEGKQRVIEAEGLLAVCLQHEIDHLEGILFVDHVSMLKRNLIMRKLKKLKKMKGK